MDKRITLAYDILKKNYQQKILLEDLARQVGLSAFHFQRLFKKEMGESPNSCLNRIRLDLALHLTVIDPQRSMTDIAYDCGFSSPAAFCRSFQKRFGQSPAVHGAALRARQSNRSYNSHSELIMQEPDTVYFPGCWILHAHTSVFRPDLLDVFHSIRCLGELEGIAEPNAKLFGVYTHPHAAFSGTAATLNYYAGVVLSVRPPARFNHRLFQIPEGRYARFVTDTSYLDLYALMMQFKEQWMDPNKLQIREPMAFEWIAEENKTGNYPRLQRLVHIAIK